ncbi:MULTISPECIES: double-strand break repair helicase AddA [Pacificimonas]|uniref:DNA 3'-5' helicase n=1 Tax=Pacificimonas aurantium TaxID=1250540 RepID=A0ABS7WM46_9SPHN|nr:MULTISPECIES: double-strand break repair helicase AddA [Pacificimonas]MBZ6379464.1 double-strand break repair helicase AddA [Pacificimonas aurantium]
MAERGRLIELTEEQKRAAEPTVHAWVSASAGTGKTQVLSARVLRLLLNGARPEGILALTFTKAAAAEMKSRIFRDLGRWVTASDEEIAADLNAIGELPDAELLRRARTLFAAALEARGGLKVQTLHAFASSLLAAFPIEAEMTPGYQTLDDRSGAQLKAEVLERAISDAASGEDRDFLADLGRLAVRHGDARAADLLGSLLRERRRLASFGSDADIETELRRILGIRAGDVNEILRADMQASGLDEALRGYAEALERWDTKSGRARLQPITAFFAAEGQEEARRLRDLFPACFTGKSKRFASNAKLEPEQSRAADCLEQLRDTVWRLEIAELASLHLRVGRRMAALYEQAKARRGAADFDDLIAEAARLLTQVPGAWVLYKLDQRLDHVLVDEGQDTNAAQWRIVEALTEEFFAGRGARAEDMEEAELRHRTQFAVGDYKQAIFGFQGTDPEEFRAARDRARERAEAAEQHFEPVPLSRSFRSVPAVLTVVDRVIAQKGAAAFGMAGTAIPPHDPHRKGQAGAVTLWPRLGTEENPLSQDDADGKERALASRIAEEVGGWLDERRFLPSRGRAVEPQDILILLRSRGDLVPELVAALHARGVPVAGADRLRLTAPLAVKDCLSLIKFAMQPEDDLSLAELLVSPFLGWSQQQLYDLAQPRPRNRRNRPTESLWFSLRHASGPHAEEARAWLGEVLSMADYRPPYDFLETILSGPLQGRSKLLRRLGEEARDPLEELLSQALAYERLAAPSLQGFLDWLAVADDIEVKRDPDAPQAAVRIMTVHGAKGLQAPVVIMADAAKAAAGQGGGGVDGLLAGEEEPRLPLYGLRRAELPERLGDLQAERERKDAEESLRLLYVAMTRAEDYLFAGGLAGKGSDSWWHVMQAALLDLEHEEVEAPRWGGLALRYREGEIALGGRKDDTRSPGVPELPDWARTPAPEEAAPPRPLTPSEGEDEDGLPPPGPALERAAERGRVLHKLFERLPDLPPQSRRQAAAAFLERRAGRSEVDGLDREALLGELFAVLDDPAHSELFSGEALREAPLTAVVEDRVIAGTVDVMLVEPHRVRLVDFKTDRNVPASLADVRERHKSQMDAYQRAAEAIFPGRRVECGLLYTAGPRLLWLNE